MINQFIIDTLSNDNDVITIVDDKIFPLVAPEETVNPFIVFKQNTLNRYLTKTTNSAVSSDETAYIMIIDTTYDGCVELSNAVIRAIEGKHGSIVNYEESFTMGSSTGEFLIQLTISKFFTLK